MIYFRFTLSFCALILFFSPTISHAVDCGDYISSDVTLTRDLNCIDGFFALEVAANNVVIDLNGFQISGTPDLYGIGVLGYENVTIKNGSMSGFWTGVNASRATNLHVERMNFFDLSQGVNITATNSSLIEFSDFIRLDSVAIYVASTLGNPSNNNRIQANEFFDVGGAVFLCGDAVDHNEIYDNLIWRYEDHAIHLNHGDRNTILRNRILEGGDNSAIRLNSSSYNTISGNAFKDGGYSAISIVADAGTPCSGEQSKLSGKNVFSDNRMMNFPVGALLGIGTVSDVRVEGNRFENNQVTENTIGIMFMEDTSSNTATGNVFTGTATPIKDYGDYNRY